MLVEAAKRLIDKGEISQDQFEYIANFEKVAVKYISPKEMIKALYKIKGLDPSDVRNAYMGIKKVDIPDVAQAAPSISSRLFNKIKPIGFGVAVTTGAAVGGKELYDTVAQKAKIKSSFERLKEKQPLLKQYPDKTLKDHFDVVKTFSPRAASNPLVASALVHKMLEYGGVDHKLVQDIAAIEARKPESVLKEVYRAGIRGATKTPEPDE